MVEVLDPGLDGLPQRLGHRLREFPARPRPACPGRRVAEAELLDLGKGEVADHLAVRRAVLPAAALSKQLERRPEEGDHLVMAAYEGAVFLGVDQKRVDEEPCVNAQHRVEPSVLVAPGHAELLGEQHR